MILIIWIILIVANWVLYHKIFNVVYFNVGGGLLKEVVGCAIAAVIEMAIVSTLLGIQL